MKITDLLEEIQRHGEEEIEFCLVDADGNTQELDLFITDGNYLYGKRDKDGIEMETVILGLRLA